MTDSLTADELIYDWNEVDRRGPVLLKRKFALHDETLRDGIQNPSVVDPGIGDKLAIVHLLDELGVESTDVGLPGAGQRSGSPPRDLGSDPRRCRPRRLEPGVADRLAGSGAL